MPATQCSRIRSFPGLAAVLASAILGGCALAGVQVQVEQLAATCTLSGTVKGERDEPGPYVVALMLAGDDRGLSPWRQVDEFVMEREGAWVFLVKAGRYRVAAFRDLDRNLRYDAGEPFLELDTFDEVPCKPGGIASGIALLVPEGGRPRKASLPVTGPSSVRGARENPVILGQSTAFGETTTLENPRFGRDAAKAGLWRPVDFFAEGQGGVYFLEPFDEAKIPVLFVHGINGSPRDFQALVGQLDRSRFQPWVYYYGSGLGLSLVADHLEATIRGLESRHRVASLCVVAHSVGGLVAREFLLHHSERGAVTDVPVFISISTPWGGHRGASLALSVAPAVLPVWRDMAPGSSFLRNLYFLDADRSDARRRLPAAVGHHLLFSYGNATRVAGTSNDGIVAVSSQLIAEAQGEARRIHGVNDSHMGILANADAMAEVNQILAKGCS